MEKIVLYVARNKTNPSEYCKGSQMCIKIAQVLPDNYVNVQDCNKLIEKQIELPAWLDGTPTVVHKHSGDFYKGTIAVRFMKSILEEYMVNRQKEPIVETFEKKEITQKEEGTPSFLGEDNESDDPENYDAWKDEISDYAKEASDLETKPKTTQQDVEAFMRQRQTTMKQVTEGGHIPEIEVQKA